MKYYRRRAIERCAANEWYNYLKRDKSIIVDSFQGQLKSVIECSVCHYALTRFESFMFLSVPTMTADDRKLETLLECMDEFSAAEHLTDDNRWFCQRCKEHQDATKTIRIWKLPKYLIIHLKRFTTKKNATFSLFVGLGSKNTKTTFTKVTHSITIPLEIMLCPVIPTESPQKLSPNFRLLSFVKHFGSAGFGHYTAYSRHTDNSWNLYDDDDVTNVNAATVQKQASDGYVFFFDRAYSPLQDEVLNLDEDGSLRQTTSRPDLWPHLEQGRQWSFISEDEIRNSFEERGNAIGASKKEDNNL